MTLANPEIIVREWLENLYASAGPDADVAREAIEMIDAGLADAEELACLEDEYGGADGLKPRLDLLDQLEEQSSVLRDLCAEAGLLAPGDYETDPLPLIRMFLPVG